MQYHIYLKTRLMSFKHGEEVCINWRHYYLSNPVSSIVRSKQINEKMNQYKILSVIVFSMLFCIHSNAQDKLYPNEFSLSDVQLLDGPFKHARDLNIETILKYNVDRLL